MKYYVSYLENGSPLLKDFDTEKARKEWLYQWLLANHHHGSDEGYEICFMFEGKITWESDYHRRLKG